MNTPQQIAAEAVPAESVPTEPPSAPAVERPAPRVRLDFLDGLRGLCAVYIAFYHVHSMTPAGDDVP